MLTYVQMEVACQLQGPNVQAGLQQGSGSQTLPPLLNAMVHSQDNPEVEPCAGSAASFLMHTSSFSPLRCLELESSSPSHPTYAQNSLQGSDVCTGVRSWAQAEDALGPGGVQQQTTGSAQGSWQQSKAETGPRHRALCCHRPSLSAANMSGADSSKGSFLHALANDDPEQGTCVVIAQDTPLCSHAAGFHDTRRAGIAADSAAMYSIKAAAASAGPGILDTAHSRLAGFLPSCNPCQAANAALVPASKFQHWPSSITEAEEASQSAAALSQRSGVHRHGGAASFPLLTTYQPRQPLSCSSNSQPTSSVQEEGGLSALNSADLAYLAARQSVQQVVAAPAPKPVQHLSKSSEDAFCACQGMKQGISSSSSQDHHWMVDMGDEDVVLHDSVSDTVLSSAHEQQRQEGTGIAFAGLDVSNLAAELDAVQALAHPHIVSRCHSRASGSQHAGAEQHTCAVPLQSWCLSCDSLYDDNDWEC